MKHIQKLFLFFAVGLTVSTFFLSSLGPLIGSAAAVSQPISGGGNSGNYYQDTDISHQVEAYVMIRAIGICISRSGLYDYTEPSLNAPGPLGDPEKNYDIIQPDSADAFNWFHGGAGPLSSDTDSFTGYLDTDNYDGKSSCHDLNGSRLQSPFSILQLGSATDGPTEACYSGFVRQKVDSSGSLTPDQCALGSGYLGWKNGKQSDTAKVFIQNVLSSYYGQSGGSLPAMTNAMKYYLYFNTLQKVCHGTARANPEKYTDKDIAKFPNLVKTTADDGTTPVVFELGSGKTKTSSVYVMTSDNLKDPVSMKCGDLAKDATKYAQDYADAVKADPTAAGTGAESFADGSGEDACNVSINPLTWILCPIFDGIGSLSDFMLNKLIVPFLKTDTLDIKQGDPTYEIWSAFRVWGNVVLVIALLVIVFGESIGGGLIDAYTAKKVLPRILITAILLNLSIYIVGVLVDFTNILGQGLTYLIHAPLNGIHLTPGDGWGIGTGKLGLTVGAAVVGLYNGSAITGFILSTMGVAGAVFADFVPFILLFIVLPAFLAIMLTFFTLVLRKAIILALILVSPVAFALYCVPNTEKYFRQWWDLLFRTLMVYPIVMVIFSVADVLAYTSIIANGKNGDGSSVFGYILAFLLQFLPLFLIPFAFRLAGGVLHRIYDVAAGLNKRGVEAIKGNPADHFALRNYVKRRAGEGLTRGQMAMRQYGARLNRDAFDPKDKLRGRNWFGGRGSRGNRLWRQNLTSVGKLGNVGKPLYRWAQMNERSEAIKRTIGGHADDADLFTSIGGPQRLEDGSIAWFSAKPESKSHIPPSTLFGGRVIKNRRITEEEWKNSLTGMTMSDFGESAEYVAGKSKLDKHFDAERVAWAGSASLANWDDSELAFQWAQAKYAHKNRLGSEYYSTPTYRKNADGSDARDQYNRRIVDFVDLSDTTPGGDGNKQFRAFLDDVRTRPGFAGSQIEDKDWRLIEERLHNDKDGYVTRLDRGETLSDEDAEAFALSVQALNSVSQESLTPHAHTEEGQPVASAVNPASKEIIERTKAQMNRGNGTWGTQSGPGSTREITITGSSLRSPTNVSPITPGRPGFPQPAGSPGTPTNPGPANAQGIVPPPTVTPTNQPVVIQRGINVGEDTDTSSHPHSTI